MIPYPNLSIKYHKTINGIGGDPTRLVIPMKNFTSTLSKLGYLEIKNVLYKSKVDYSCFTIVQASDLKD